MTVWEIKNPQHWGKTALMVALNMINIESGLYKWSETYGNVVMPEFSKLGYHYLKNSELLAFIAKVFKGDMQHVSIMVDEADQLLSAYAWDSKEQRRQLQGIFQDEKLELQLYMVEHQGPGVDKMVRDATQFLLKPCYRPDRNSDVLPYARINLWDQDRPKFLQIENMHLVFPMYRRYQLVV